MYIIKNSANAKNVVFFDADVFERAIRFAIQTNVPQQNFKNILNDCTINISNEMKDYARIILNQVRTEGKEVEVVDLSQYKGEEFNIKFPIFDSVYGSVRALTSSVPGRDGKYAVGLSWQGVSKINTSEKE